MKIAFRNFLTTLRRYRTSSLMNIGGLTVAFTAFYLILVQVQFDLTYNRCFPGAERIYHVMAKDNLVGDYAGWVNRPVTEKAIASTPSVEAGGCLWGGFSSQIVWTANPGGKGYDLKQASVGDLTLPLLDLFSFESVAGDVHDLKRPKTVILSRKTAERLGVQCGDLIWVETENPTGENSREVVAIFADFPRNSLLHDCEVACNLGDKFMDDWGEWSFNYFVRLHEGTSPEEFEQQYLKAFAESGRGEPGADFVRLMPLKELYFHETGYGEHGSWATTYTLLGIAVLIIVLAFVNFINFFFALVPVRLKTVNTFKIFGAPTAALRFSFLFEAVGLVICALLLSLYFVYVLSGTPVVDYISASIVPHDHLFVTLLTLFIALFMAVVAGGYPAYYITSFAPALAVKGRFGGTRRGRQIRMALLAVQFTIAAGLITATLFMARQYLFMTNYDIGLNTKNLISVSCERNRCSPQQVRDALQSDPRIADITLTPTIFLSVQRMGWGREFKGQNISMHVLPVQSDFLRFMGIPITEGRDFTSDDALKEGGVLIFNETSSKQYDIHPGDKINGFNGPAPVVGICRDFHSASLRSEIGPFALYVLPHGYSGYWADFNVIYLRLQPDAPVGEVAESVRQQLAAMNTHIQPSEVEVRRFEEEIGGNYLKEKRLMIYVATFALLAIAIALLGVFGLVLFETQYRRHEVAVRKVMGATTGEILGLFNRHYLTVACISCLVATPVVWYAIGLWYRGFAYHTDRAWWVFALGCLIVLAITVLTVTVRSWRAANTNPVECMKN